MAKVIELTKGYFALVDDEDFEQLNRYKWQATFNGGHPYARRVVQKNRKRETIYMHGAIMGVSGVDHISHDLNRFKLIDNRRSNLRVANQSRNGANQRKQSRNLTSKYKGVHWYGRYNRWETQINCDQKQIYLGRFFDEKEAARAYDTKAEELFGDFALTNKKLYPQDFEGEHYAQTHTS